MSPFSHTIIRASPLRDRFLFFFSIAACVPVLMLGVAALFVIDRSHRADVSKLERQLINEKAGEIEQFFDSTLGLLEIRLDPALLESSSGWENDIPSGILNENQAFTEISIVDLQGKEIKRTSRDGLERDLLYVSELAAFKAAAEGRTFVSDVHRSFSGLSVTLGAPVLVDNNVIRVIIAEVALRDLVRSIDASRLGTAGYLIAVDRDGTALNRKNAGANIGVIDRVRRVLEGETFDGLGPRDRYESVIGSGAVSGAAKHIPNIGWALLAEWPVADADAVILEVRSQVLLVTVLSILLVALIVPLLIARLLRPIRLLEEGASQIEKGNFENHLTIKTKDELQELGEAFNRMSVGLKRLQELKNEFVFIAAHELRSPVTAVRGYLSLVREGDGGPVSTQLQKLLDPIWQANERLVQLIEDLLEIARSEAGKLKVSVVPLDMRQSIKAILTEAKSLADQKHITFTYEESAELPLAMADDGRIKEVIMNFVSNAIKYNNENGWVKIYHEIDSGGVVTHVEDNGFGMTEEQQKHMFEKFYRAETEKIRSITGTGLGMFITKELIEKMGGTVWLSSAEGKGTRFSFRLLAEK